MTYTYLIPELYAFHDFSKVYMGKKNLQSDYIEYLNNILNLQFSMWLSYRPCGYFQLIT